MLSNNSKHELVHAAVYSYVNIIHTVAYICQHIQIDIDILTCMIDDPGKAAVNHNFNLSSMNFIGLIYNII